MVRHSLEAIGSRTWWAHPDLLTFRIKMLTFPVNVPITADVGAGTLELVLEVVTADGQGLGNEIFIGANSAAETGISYISAADCGLTDPTPVGDIGFPNSHWVFVVHGSCPARSPTPTATARPRLQQLLRNGNLHAYCNCDGYSFADGYG